MPYCGHPSCDNCGDTRTARIRRSRRYRSGQPHNEKTRERLIRQLQSLDPAARVERIGSGAARTEQLLAGGHTALVQFLDGSVYLWPRVEARRQHRPVAKGPRGLGYARHILDEVVNFEPREKERAERYASGRATHWERVRFEEARAQARKDANVRVQAELDALLLTLRAQPSGPASLRFRVAESGAIVMEWTPPAVSGLHAAEAYATTMVAAGLVHTWEPNKGTTK